MTHAHTHTQIDSPTDNTHSVNNNLLFVCGSWSKKKKFIQYLPLAIA